MRHLIFLNGLWPATASHPHLFVNRTIGPYQLKHWLSHFGFRSQVIDFCQLLTSTEILGLIDQFAGSETIAVGVSTNYWPANGTVPENLEVVLSSLRLKYPKIQLVAGGARGTKHKHLFDKCFVGDSEDSLLAWLEERRGRKGWPNRRFDITTLAHRFDDSDGVLSTEVLPIELGRGCVFKCKFCAHPNLGKSKFTYQRGFDLFLDEVRWNKEQFGVSTYNFMDDTVNEDSDKTQKLSQMSRTLGFDVRWNGYLRADLVWSRKESPEQLLESGLSSCFFGIETFNNTAGKSIDKGWGSKHGKTYLPKLYEDLWHKKIPLWNSFIVGLPGEDAASVRDTAAWCLDHAYMGSYRFSPLSLYLDTDESKTSSEFNRNYASNGYQIAEDGSWFHEKMTQAESVRLAEQINFQAASYAPVSSWYLFSLVGLGVAFEDARKMNLVRMATEVRLLSTQFKTNYLNKLSLVKR